MALTLVVTTLLFVGVASARATWGKPFELTTPGSLDYLGPQLAFSPQGAAAAAFQLADVDTPGSGRAYLVTRSPGGKVGPARALAGVSQVLSLAYVGSRLELLVGSSPANQDCCSTAETIAVSASGAVAKAQQLVGGLTGSTHGELVTLAGGQLMAAVATERGVWVAQSAHGDRFGAQHLVSDKGQEPVSMSAAWTGGGASIVAWTAGRGVIGAIAPRSIDYATGSRRQAPRGARVALTVPAGHRIDELAVARHATGSTLAWIESWYDKKGAYHSRVEAADLATHPQIRALSPDNRLASGLAFDDDPAGDQAATWESCTSSDACTVQAAGRPDLGGDRRLPEPVTDGQSQRAGRHRLGTRWPSGRLGGLRIPVGAVLDDVCHRCHGGLRSQARGAGRLDPGDAQSQRRGCRLPRQVVPPQCCSAAAITSRTGGAAAAAPAPWLGNSAPTTILG
jgi:hypothetical protein